MYKKLILSSMISLALHAQAENYDKFSIQAGQPSIKQASQSTANQLVLAVGAFDPLTELLDFSKSKIPSMKSSKYTIVQFNDTKADSTWLINQGLKVVSYLPNNAFVVVNTVGADKILAKNKDIRWHGQFLSNYKIAPDLWSTNLKLRTDYNVMISFFNDFSGKQIPTLLKKYLPKAKIEQNLGGNTGIILTLENKDITNSLKILASIDAIQYVQRAKKQRFFNTEAVSAMQGNLQQQAGPRNDNYVPTNTPIWDRGLIGTGQIVGVADSGLDANEDWFTHYDNGTTVTDAVTEAEETVVIESTDPNEFDTYKVGTTHPDRKVFGYFIMPRAAAYDHGGATGFHGTHVTGSVAGDRQQSIGAGPSGSISSATNPGYDNDDGMAPNAQILFQDLGTDEGLAGIGTYPMWDQAYNAGARIHSNSYGSNGDGEYSFSDIRLDRALRKYEDMLILFAAGNDGPGDNTIGSPGNAKNGFTIGATLHGNSPSIRSFSGRGPTDDGRMKPDVVAPGNNIESARGDVNTTTTIEAPQRATISGTSMSTPLTAGSSALMRQYYTDGFYPTGSANPTDAHTPSGPLMKATMINGAGVDGGHFDKNYGFGRVNLANSLMFNDSDRQLRAWEVVNANGLKTGENMQFEIGVKADQPLAITLAWYDVPGPFGSSKTLVNDIDLTVSVNGKTYKGNVFSDVAVSGTGGTRDSLNSVEQVRIPNPEEGIYTITINGANIPGDENINSFRQGFGLVATGHFDNIGATPAALTAVTNLSAAMQGDNGVNLAWSGGDNADYYEIYKVEGSCATADFRNVRIAGTSSTPAFTDFRTLNGSQYAYKIRAVQYKTLGDLSTTCADITSAQACDFLPSFSERSIQVVDNIGDTCHTKLQWSAATNSCPGENGALKYNIYRSEDSDFIPSPDNLLTTVNSTSYDDIRAPDTAAFYIIRAVDNNGTETLGSTRIRSQAIAAGETFSPVLEDVDNVSISNLAFPWQVVSDKAADNSTLSYKTGGAGGNYPAGVCGNITSRTIKLSDDLVNPELSYQASFNIEENWDGVVVEISTDDGATWVDFPPVGGYPGDFSETTTDDNDVLINACRYPATQKAFSGTNGETFTSYTHDLSPFTGQDVKVRWQLSTDLASEFEGFYLDNISYPNIGTPNSCVVNTAPDKPEPGLYYDKSKNGHGFVIEPIANSDLYFTVFYTYKDDGTPEWYTSLSTLENNVLTMADLKRFNYDFNVDPTGAGNPNTLDTTVGETALTIDFNSSSITSNAACTDGTARGESIALATWQIGDQAADWCIEPLILETPTNDFGGTWWTGVDDDGWGLSLSFTNTNLVVVTIYFFDSEGKPRWSQGVATDFQTGQEINIDMKQFTGFGRLDTPVDLSNVVIGTLGLTINNTGTDGNINLDINYQGTEGGNWNRTNMPITIFSAPH